MKKITSIILIVLLMCATSFAMLNLLEGLIYKDLDKEVNESILRVENNLNILISESRITLQKYTDDRMDAEIDLIKTKELKRIEELKASIAELVGLAKKEIDKEVIKKVKDSDYENKLKTAIDKLLEVK